MTPVVYGGQFQDLPATISPNTKIWVFSGPLYKGVVFIYIINTSFENIDHFQIMNDTQYSVNDT